MKKFFIVTDVHSFFTLMQEALNREGFNLSNPDHIFVSLGDLFDRGDETVKLLKWVNSIPSERKILIRGNHEDLLEDCIQRREFYQYDLTNGTLKTVFNLCGRDADSFWFDDGYKSVFDEIKRCKPLYKYLRSTQDFAEVGDYVFVHGWIPSRKSSPNRDWRQGNWQKARWFNGMEKWRQGAVIEGKTIVCGHFHTSWGWAHIRHKYKEYPSVGEPGFEESFKPFIDKGIVALDACTAFSGICNCFVINEEVI